MSEHNTADLTWTTPDTPRVAGLSRRPLDEISICSCEDQLPSPTSSPVGR